MKTLAPNPSWTKRTRGKHPSFPNAVDAKVVRDYLFRKSLGHSQKPEWFYDQHGSYADYAACLSGLSDIQYSLIETKELQIGVCVEELISTVKHYLTRKGWQGVNAELSKQRNEKSRASLKLPKDVHQRLNKYMADHQLDNIVTAIDNLLANERY